MIPNDQSELLLDQINLRLGPDIPSPFQSIGFSEASVRNELRALQQLNGQLREKAASLQSRNEELKAYAHTVAHALKNPLAVLILIASAIGEITDLTPEELKDYKQQIKTTAFEMDDIIKDLLLLSEVDMADHLSEPLNMGSVVARARKRLNHMTKEYRGRIISPKTWPVATGYAPWIEEVWVNYISNALKYGGRSPHIELGASIQPDGMVRFWVRDHGQGIPPRKQARLFNPFTRLGQVNRPGNGLGLSIVRRIVEKLGGRAGVESQAGQGSLFFFTLPTTYTGLSWRIDQGGTLDWPSAVPLPVEQAGKTGAGSQAKMESVPDRMPPIHRPSGSRMPAYPHQANQRSLYPLIERSKKNGKETISREGNSVRDGGK